MWGGSNVTLCPQSASQFLRRLLCAGACPLSATGHSPLATSLTSHSLSATSLTGRSPLATSPGAHFPLATSSTRSSLYCLYSVVVVAIFLISCIQIVTCVLEDCHEYAPGDPTLEYKQSPVPSSLSSNKQLLGHLLENRLQHFLKKHQ